MLILFVASLCTVLSGPAFFAKRSTVDCEESTTSMPRTTTRASPTTTATVQATTKTTTTTYLQSTTTAKRLHQKLPYLPRKNLQNAVGNTTTDVGMRSWIPLAALVAISVAYQNADFVTIMTKRKKKFYFAPKSRDFINKIWLKKCGLILLRT